MKCLSIWTGLILYLSLICSPAFAEPNIELIEPVWDLGSALRGEVIEKTFRIKNTGNDKLVIKKVRPSCDCISVNILKSEAEKGGFAEVKAVLDTNSKEVKNKFTKYIYIQSNDLNEPVIRISIVGVLTNGVEIKEAVNNKDVLKDLGNKSEDAIKIYLFYSPGCMGCKKVKDVFLVKLKEEYKEKLDIELFDISILENYLKLIDFDEKYRVKENDPMVVFTGDRYFSGKNAILNKLELYLKDLIVSKQIKDENLKKLSKGKLLNRFRSFSPAIVLSAGFIDGLNPCAFVTAVFLVSFLLLAKRSRREVFLIGLVFSLGVFVSYLLIGLGLRSVLNKLLIFNTVANVIYLSAIFLMFILAFYSLYDAFIYLKHGNAKDMKLKLPEIFVQKIHAVIRTNIGNKSLIFFVFIAGFLVSILESICTGQVYLPTIMFMIKEPSMRGSSYLYLFLYNISFIIPLLLVILLVLLGVSLERLVAFSKKNTFLTKIFLSILFFVMGILLISAR